MKFAVNIVTSIEVILEIILKKYFNSSNSIAVISDKKLEVNSFEIPFQYFNSLDNDSLLRNVVKIFDSGCLDFFVHIQEPTRFMEAFEESVHLSYARSSKRRVVILPFSDDASTLYDVLNTKAAKYLPNILIVIPQINSSCDVFNLITHKFVGVVNTNEPILLDTWDSCSGEFRQNENLFPHDMSNMQGKAFKAAGFTYNPYVLLDPTDHVKANENDDGTEIRLCAEFCRWINCSLEIVGDDGEQWGQVFPNRTGTGLLGKVLEDHADVGLDGMAYWYEDNLVMDHSITYKRSEITCLAPTPRMKPSWLNPIRPFDWTMWVAVLVTIFAFVVALVLHTQPVSNSLLMSFGMLLEQSQPTSWLHPKIRSLILWLQLAGLLVTNSYTGALAGVYTVPLYEQPIDTMEDLADSNLSWAGTHDVWIFSLYGATDAPSRRLVENFKIYNTSELRARSTTEDLAFAMERFERGFIVPIHIPEEAVPHLKLMRDRLYYLHIVLFTRKSSPYTEKANELISRINNAGIMLSWETQVFLKHTNYKTQQGIAMTINLHHEVEASSLKLDNVLGIFILYGFGIVASIIAFITELYTGKKRITTVH